MRTRSWTAAVVLSCVLAAAVSASAQISWVVADRDAAQISSLVGKLMPFVEKLPGQDGADAVVLFNQLQTRVEDGKAEMCRNLLLEVRNPEALDEQLTSPWVDADIEITHLAAFILRNGEKMPLAEESLQVLEGAKGYGRTRCQVSWSGIEKGDVVGWSWVGNLDQNPPALSFAVANVYPTVISNLTLDGGGQFVYDFRTVGFPTKNMSLKEREIQEGEPSLWKASVNAMAAVDEIPVEPPYPASVPHVAATLKKVWLEPQGGPIRPQWLEFGGWNSTAQAVQSLVVQAERDAGKLDILLSAITTGKTTDDEKIDAVYRHVQQKIQNLEGEDITPRGLRDENLMKVKSATPLEKVVMMSVLLHELEIPASLSLVHTPALGEFDESRQDWLQFDHFAVRTGDLETGAFYVPQCADCAPGELPADWVGGTALIAPANVAELAREFGQAQQKKAINAGDFNLTKMRREQEEQPWHKLVKLGE